MAKRKGLSKRTRFEVFKRDSFTCQYCGGKAPDVVLRVDHITPVSKGGDNDLMNLVTACQNCNAGKSNVELSDDAALEARRKQMEMLQERREQLQMIADWQMELRAVEEEELNIVAQHWTECSRGYSLNERGRQGLRKLMNRHSIGEIMEAMRAATASYLEVDADGAATQESVEKAWSKVGGILHTKIKELENPYLRDAYYIRAICRNRYSYCNEWQALDLINQAIKLDPSNIENLKKFAKECRNWSEWRDGMERYIEKMARGENGEEADDQS